jgi:hypothetical protein
MNVNLNDSEPDVNEMVIALSLKRFYTVGTPDLAVNLIIDIRNLGLRKKDGGEYSLLLRGPFTVLQNAYNYAKEKYGADVAAIVALCWQRKNFTYAWA